MGKLSPDRREMQRKRRTVKPVKLEILHTGTVIVDEALPYHRTTDRALAWTHLARGRSHLVEVPVSCYLVEAPGGLVLIDTGWHTDNRTWPGQVRNLRHRYLVNRARLPEGQAIHEQLEARGLRPRDIDLVLLSHLHCDHADGLRLVRDAPRIMVAATELRAAEKDRARYLPHEWAGVDLQTFGWNTRLGPVQRAWDVFGDGAVLMVSVPGHAWGLCATILRGGEAGDSSPGEDSLLGEDPRDVVILSSDAGYGRPSFEQGLRPSVVVDAALAQRSLDWVRAAAGDPRVRALIANHDPEQRPRVIEF